MSSLKGDSVDDLFAKQNQYGAQHTGNSPNPAFTFGAFQGGQSLVPDHSTNQGNKQQFTFGANQGGFPDINFEDEFNLIAPTTLQKPATTSNFPKPPEKASIQTPTTSNFNETTTKKPLNFGSITGLDLGGKNKPASTSMGQKPQPMKASNYDAFDTITPDHQSGGGGFGMTFGGNGGMNSGHTGGSNGFELSLGGGNHFNAGNSLGNSHNYGMGSTINSQLIDTNELMSGFGGSSGGGGGMNLTFGHGMGGMASDHGGFKSSDDPFSRGMDGLMSSHNMANMTFGGNSMGGMGGMGGSSMGGFGGSSHQGGLMDLGNYNSSGMGGSLGGSNSFGGGMGPYSSQSQQKPPGGGILSNPNLTFKTAKDNQKPSSNNFNEFDLL